MDLSVILHLLSNFLPRDKILVWADLKAFTNDKPDIGTFMIPVFDRKENIFGKVESVVTSLFSFSHSPFPTMFSNGFFLRVVESRDCVVNGQGEHHY